MNDYIRYRGKCKEISESMVNNDPSLTIVRGWYNCPFDGKQQHWWCKDVNGNIVDGSKKQFKSNGIGEYIEYNGIIECDECGKSMPENEAQIDGRYAFCSTKCHLRFVGLEVK